MTPSQALTDELHWAFQGMTHNPPRGLDADMLRVRFHSYRPRISGPHAERYACPRCFLHHGERHELRSVSGTDEFDLLACAGCSNEFVIPFE